jgi:hypothetical protein
MEDHRYAKAVRNVHQNDIHDRLKLNNEGDQAEVSFHLF